MSYGVLLQNENAKKVIRILFGTGTLKKDEHPEMFDVYFEYKQDIDGYFQVINRGVMECLGRDELMLTAPVLEYEEDYDPYKNLIPTSEMLIKAMRDYPST